MRFIFFALGLSFAAWLGAQTAFQSPTQYFDFFQQTHTAVVTKNMDYIQHAVHSDDLPAILRKRQELLRGIDVAAQKIAALQPYPQDAGMRQEMLDILAFYRAIFATEFQEVELMKQNSSESFEAMERYLFAQDAAELKLAQAGARFLAAQRNFARTNGIQLLEGAPDPEAEQLRKLNAYQRAIYLASFRAGKLDANFQDALRQGAERVALESLRLQLENAVKEELAKLRNMPAFNGNTGYRDATIRQLELLLELAAQNYPAMIKVAAKGASSPTQEDVDAYNAGVQKVNTDMNARIEQVNQAMIELMRQNVPKPSVRGTKEI